MDAAADVEVLVRLRGGGERLLIRPAERADAAHAAVRARDERQRLCRAGEFEERERLTREDVRIPPKLDQRDRVVERSDVARFVEIGAIIFQLV